MLKQQINNDFLLAMKARNQRAKCALGMLKTKITEAEKANSNNELDDTQILKIIVSSIKQRKQSIDEFTKGNRLDLVKQEEEELDVINVYMPKQLSIYELREKIVEISKDISRDNINKFNGTIMGIMNKQYSGQFDNKELTEILKTI